jgi:hypothetical protein
MFVRGRERERERGRKEGREGGREREREREKYTGNLRPHAPKLVKLVSKPVVKLVKMTNILAKASSIQPLQSVMH